MTPSPLTIVRYPDPVLGRRASPISVIDEEVRALAGRMIELMYGADGVGLAAPQVGVSKRLFVADPRLSESPDPVVFINPEISVEGEQDIAEEGCLSIPEIRLMVTRPVRARIRAQDLDGDWFELEADEFPARVWQHEFDHLEGRLIIDRMTPRERLVHRRALKALRETYDLDHER